MSTETVAAELSPAPSLEKRALRGAMLAFAQHGGSQALRLLANLVVTRLLFAEAFGVMSLVQVLMHGLTMVSDIGIAQVVIRSERGDDKTFLDTIWTVQLVRGVALWLIACALAVPFSKFFGAPELAQIIPVASLTSVINALSPTKEYTVQRHLQLGRLALIEVTSQIISLLVMVGLAWRWPSVWSLVAGSLCNSALNTILIYVYLPGPSNRLCWDKESRQELVGFGRWVFVSTMLTFAADSMDRLVFGKLITLEQLGLYSIGKTVASAPSEAVSHVGSAVVYPYYSRIVNSGQPLAPVFAKARRPLLVLAGWGLALLAATGQAIIDILYDDRYRASGWVVQVLALGGWYNMLWTTNVSALLALGQSRWMAATTAVKTVATLLLIPVGYYLGGFPGAVIAFAAAELVQVCVSATAVASNKLAAAWHDLPSSLFVLLTAAAGYWVGRFGGSSILCLLLSTAVVTAMWLPVALPLLRAFLRGEKLLA